MEQELDLGRGAGVSVGVGGDFRLDALHCRCCSRAASDIVLLKVTCY